MNSKMNRRLCLIAAALLGLSTVASAAVAPKPGLWTLEVLMGNDVPQLDPDLLSQFGLEGLQVPKVEPSRYEVCLTPEQLARNTFPDIRDDRTGCVAKNLQRTGDKVNGDLVCDGWLRGTGRVEILLLDAERYSGRTLFQGSSQEGFPMNLSGSLNGRWMKADCGAIKPL